MSDTIAQLAAAVPLKTERQAAELPEVRAVCPAFEARPGVGKMAPHNERMLERLEYEERHGVAA